MNPQELFGRDRELGVVTDLLDHVREHGGALLIRGEVGIGKSALLTAAARQAVARSMRVLTTTGVESEAHLPFAGLHQLLHSVLPGIELLPGPQRTALQAAFGLIDAAAPDPFLIALATLTLLGDAAAQGPLLLIADDARWIDRPTCEVLTFVARRLEAEPVILLVAIRDGVESPLNEAALPALHLEALDDTAANALLDAHTPDLAPAIRARLLSEAAGNPLALVELRTALRTEHLAGSAPLPAWLPLTTRIERAFTAQLAELPSATRTLLLVAAADDAGEVAAVLEAAALILGDTFLSADALEPALDARLIEADETRLRFRHPLVRTAIYQAASLPQRHAVHSALAQALAKQPDRQAWHRAAACVGPDEAVATELEAAAIRSARRGAVAIAAMAFERAARLSADPAGRSRRLLRAAQHAFVLGREEDLTQILRAAASQDLADTDRARLTTLTMMTSLAVGPGDGSPSDGSALLALVELATRTIAAGDTELGLNILFGAALKCRWIEPGAHVREAIVTCAEQATVADDEPAQLMVLALADPIGRAGSVMARLAQIPPESHLSAPAAYCLFAAARDVGAYHSAARFAAIAMEQMRAQGWLGTLTPLLVLHGMMSVFTTNLHQASAEIAEGRVLAQETRQPLWEAAALAAGALVAGLRGESDEAEAQAAAATRLVPTHSSLLLAKVQHARGVAALGAGRYADAYHQLQRIYDPADPAYHPVKGHEVIDLLVEAALHSGHQAEAVQQTEVLRQRADATPSPRFGIPLRFARAVLADDADAEALFAEALHGDIEGYPLDRARLQLAFGTWLRRQRRVTESRVQLRAAREAFDALGVLPWSERARGELRAAGEASVNRTPHLLDQLTPQELQIAQLAAAGLSNREIGERLYLSHRTVGSHLYRIFPKLGVTARAELRVALDTAMPALA
jgi:DNA-binding NarL/FixJ family response regulator